MNEIVQRVDQATGELEKLYQEFYDCNSDRTMTQLRFMMDMHPTPGRKFLHVTNELRGAYAELRRMKLDREEQQGNVVPNLNDIKGRRALLRIEELDFGIDAKVKECGKLLALRKELIEAHGGKPYTMRELEEEDPEYFTKRLRHQIELDVAVKHTGIGYDNLRFAEQLNLVKVEFRDGILRIEDTLGLFPKQLEAKG